MCLILLVLLVLLVPAAHALAGPRWALMVEPSFMDYKIRRPVAGSERTILALVRIDDNGGTRQLAPDEMRSTEMTSGQIEEAARKTASDVLSRIQPRFVRDKNKVIEYAVLESPDPLTASCVLAPEFGAKFAATLGPDLLVAMPNRNQVLVFCRQDAKYQQLAEFIVSGYLGSNYPVSREIFEINNGRLSSLGVIP